MKKLILIPILALVVSLATGCVNLRQSEVLPDGTHKEFRASAFFGQQAIKGLNANSQTKETRTGIKLTSSDAAGDSEAISATGGLIGTAIGTALKTAK